MRFEERRIEISVRWPRKCCESKEEIARNNKQRTSSSFTPAASTTLFVPILPVQSSISVFSISSLYTSSFSTTVSDRLCHSLISSLPSVSFPLPRHFRSQPPSHLTVTPTARHSYHLPSHRSSNRSMSF